MSYRKADNRFTWIKDFEQAQSLADAQLRTDWVAACEELRRTYHPLHEKIGRPLNGLSYYWTAPKPSLPVMCFSVTNVPWSDCFRA